MNNGLIRLYRTSTLTVEQAQDLLGPYVILADRIANDKEFWTHYRIPKDKDAGVIKHAKKEFECEHCGRRDFVSATAVYLHIRMVHEGQPHFLGYYL